MTCQVFARWPARIPAERWEPLPPSHQASIEEILALSSATPGSTWLPDLPEVDAETTAAFAVWRDEGLVRTVDDRSIVYPEFVPFRANHLGEVLAEFQVDRRGDAFEAIGELDEDVAATLKGFFHVSPHHRYTRARVIDDGMLPRHVHVTEAELLELSAVRDPGLPDTTLMVGNPGSRWIPASTTERFARLRGPDRLTLAFPGTVEVI